MPDSSPPSPAAPAGGRPDGSRGGVLHTLPLLIPEYRTALVVAVATIAFELSALAWIRWRFFHTGFLRSFASVALGGAIIVGVSAALGGAAG
jgi:erythrin-vacuolar iron transport family protein